MWQQFHSDSAEAADLSCHAGILTFPVLRRLYADGTAAEPEEHFLQFCYSFCKRPVNEQRYTMRYRTERGGPRVRVPAQKEASYETNPRNQRPGKILRLRR